MQAAAARVVDGLVILRTAFRRGEVKRKVHPKIA
jgi:hypothetical protein